MKTVNKLIRKNLKKMKAQQDERRRAIHGWWLTYSHRYPNLTEASPDPTNTLLEMMIEKEISVLQAADAAEDFAVDWLAMKETNYEDNAETEVTDSTDNPTEPESTDS